MKIYLVKLKYKSQQDADEATISASGRITLSRKNIVCHEFPLTDKHANQKLPLEARISDGLSLNSPGSDAAISPSGGLSSSPATTVLGNQTNTVSAATSLGEYTMPERNFWQGI